MNETFIPHPSSLIPSEEEFLMSLDAPFEPPDWLDREEEVLAPYAMRTRQSRGRRHPEPAHPFRTLYQRDRDRVIHSTAFRRLMYKTQVLVAQTNDHHRTRLTHTLEVAQISRTIARQLGLNEDLTETIALTHDLGHPPFGHAGERALDECMSAHGGFEHNRHGLRIVESLEYRYADYPGLNLTFEVLEAMAQHSKRREAPELDEYRRVGTALLEAQVVDASDSLAYDTHDVDDAIGADLLSADDMDAVEFWRLSVERVRKRYGNLGPLQFLPTVIRAMVDWQVTDLLDNTRQRLRDAGIRTLDDVRRGPDNLVEPGPEMRRLKDELEDFLHERVYGHYRVVRMATKGRRIVATLFEEICRQPELLPDRYKVRVAREGRERVACDYLAGMTDRYAQDEYLRLFQPYTGV
jgi:dGTPase